MTNTQQIYLRCDDLTETAVFSKHIWDDGDTDYEFTIEDSYCGNNFMGIKGRFKRAWKAFWAKPVSYTGVYCQGEERMKGFLEDCLSLMGEHEKALHSYHCDSNGVSDYNDFVSQLQQDKKFEQFVRAMLKTR